MPKYLTHNGYVSEHKLGMSGIIQRLQINGVLHDDLLKVFHFISTSFTSCKLAPETEINK
jgi:hypothetical protein